MDNNSQTKFSRYSLMSENVKGKRAQKKLRKESRPGACSRVAKKAEDLNCN